MNIVTILAKFGCRGIFVDQCLAIRTSQPVLQMMDRIPEPFLVPVASSLGPLAP